MVGGASLHALSRFNSFFAKQLYTVCTVNLKFECFLEHWILYKKRKLSEEITALVTECTNKDDFLLASSMAFMSPFAEMALINCIASRVDPKQSSVGKESPSRLAV